MIYITGDTHGNIDRFNISQTKKFNQDDVLIVCGDFGFIWNGDNHEDQLLNKLSKKKFTICFVDGTHENFSLLNNFPVISWNNGKVHKIRNNIFHLMRGEIFNINGETLFALGGGESPNKEERISVGNWWQEELPSDLQISYAEQNLNSVGNSVDYVVTHIPPLSVRKSLVGNIPYVNSFDIFLTKLSENLNYKKWFFGSLHIDRKITSKYYSVFDNIISTKPSPKKCCGFFKKH